MKVIGILSQLRKNSNTEILLQYAKQVAPPSIQIEFRTLHEIPLFNQDLEDPKLYPEAVQKLREDIRSSVGILFATAEYNHSIPGVLKNTIDWLSRNNPTPSPITEKKAGVIGGGGYFACLRSQDNLKHLGRSLNINFLRAPDVNIQYYNGPKKFENGQLIDPISQQLIQNYLKAFAEFITAKLLKYKTVQKFLNPKIIIFSIFLLFIKNLLRNMKVLGICSQLRKNSNTEIILNYARQVAPKSIYVETCEIRDIPLYNQDFDNIENYPQAVRLVREQFRESKAILFAIAEFNHQMPGVISNLIDWLGRDYVDKNPLQGKKAGVIGGGGYFGGLRGQDRMKHLGWTVKMNILQNPSVTIQHRHGPQKFQDGKLIHEESKKQIETYMNEFAKFVTQ